MGKYILSVLIILMSTISYAGDISSPPPTDPVYHLRIFDDFMSGTNTTGVIGALGWSFATTLGATTVTGIAGELNHNGIRNISLSAVLNAISSFNASVGAIMLAGGSNFDLTYIVRPNTNTDMEFRVGTQNTTTSAAPPAHGSYFVLDTAATSSETGAANVSQVNWVCVTRASSVSTVTNSGIVVSNTTWYKLRVQKISATLVNFYVDGVLKCTHTTNIATAAQFLGIQLENLAGAAAKDYDMDFMSFKIDGIVR